MVRIQFDISIPITPSESIMDDTFGKNLVSLTGVQSGTLQDVAYNLVQDRSNAQQTSGTKERTIFVLGSKGVVSN